MPAIEKTLEQKVLEKKAAKTVWDSDKKDWVNLSIPAENSLGEKHAPISVNGHEFEAGRSYLIPPQVAETVNDILRNYNRSCIRVLQPRRDVTAEMQVDRFTHSGGSGSRELLS